MNSIEHRLRDAYRGATDTVRPEAILQFDEPSVALGRPSAGQVRRSYRRLTMPLAAAAAFALVAALTAIVLPRVISGSAREHHGGHQQSPSAATGPAGRFLVQVSGKASNAGSDGFLTVRGVPEGTVVARIAPPEAGMYFAGLATGDGRHYVTALWRSGVCRTWLYQFQLNDAGQPSTLEPYRVSSVRQMLGPIAVSGDNLTFGYVGHPCRGRTTDLSVVRLVTMRTRFWTAPGRTLVLSLSLTSGGGTLAYSTGLIKFMPSDVYVLRSDAPPGQLARRSHVVARAAGYGVSDEINSAVITPDGSTVYFTTNPTGRASDNRWQLRAADLRTGHSRVIRRYTGFPGPLIADPSVYQAIVVISQLSPLPSPSPSGPTSAPSPSPSPSGRRTLLPEPPPTPSSTSPAGNYVRTPVALISLGTGRLTPLRGNGWPTLVNGIFAW
ncbi:MAG TPA: hypothetical protein VF834_20470 [Streptosporangiaceae bacterium]